ncbi:hypothetical protein [Microbacterium sp.]|uniref:hypothetical protein n=1 Tax=Microbacterium sp. TaxID=51671 RepID=UPI002811463E|nr:hypothetical protein [Microbacterium sp.]
MQQPTASTEGWPHARDPQGFTEGDKLAWKIVGYCAAGVTILGVTAGVVAFVVFGSA